MSQVTKQENDILYANFYSDLGVGCSFIGDVLIFDSNVKLIVDQACFPDQNIVTESAIVKFEFQISEGNSISDYEFQYDFESSLME